MKNFIPVLAAGLLILSCNNKKTQAEAKNTDLIAQNLKGKVEHMVESYFFTNDEGISIPDSVFTVSEFDEKGYLEKVVTKDSTGRIVEQQLMTHHNKGQNKSLTKEVGDKKQETWEIAVDGNGRYTEAKIFDENHNLKSYLKNITENEFGQLTSGTAYTPDNRIQSSFISTFIGANLAERLEKDENGKVSYHTSNKLDDKGNVVEQIVESPGETERTKFKYDGFDAKGNWVQRTAMDANGRTKEIVKRSFTYYKD